MDWNDPSFIYRLVCGLLLIMQTISRLWMTQNSTSPGQSRNFHKERESFLVRLAGGAVLLGYLYVFLPETGYFDFPLPLPVRWAGAALMLAGNLIFIAAYAELGKQWSAELVIKDGHRLVDSGIYHWIRHPMYTGFLLFGIGMGLLSANLYGCAYLCVITVLVIVRIKSEEDMMIEVFGDSYKEYKSRTSALIPGIF